MAQRPARPHALALGDAGDAGHAGHAGDDAPPTRAPLAVRAADGWPLRGELITPVGPVHAVAVLCHAMFADRRTMDRPRGAGLGSRLARRGVAALCFDLRGHGASGPSAREGAHYGLDDFIRFDIPALLAEARRRFADQPLTLVGHSLGGLAGLVAAGLGEAGRPDALVALAVNLGVPGHNPEPLRRVARTAMLVAWGGLAWARGHAGPDVLRGRGPSEPWRYVRHYLSICLRDRFRSDDGAVDYAAALGAVEIPVLSIASDGDRMLAPPVMVDRFMRALVRAPLTRRVVPGDAPGGAAPDHMGLVTDPAAAPLWDEIAAFCRVATRRPRSAS